uniref:Flavin-containing monooxygenase n=1 Tax=Haemonchus placei TaxID=6290 RepID=A0A0N4WUI4_HAEPC
LNVKETPRFQDDIDTFTEDKVIVKSGKSFDCDVLILCTGYTFGFPYLDKTIINIEKDHEVPLYKFVFPPKNPNIAVIGSIQPIGSIAPISEIQARWVTQVFVGNAKLPSEKEMWKDIDLKRRVMKKRYFASEKHTMQVDFVKYMDEIAIMVGCKPNLWKDEYFRYASMKTIAIWSTVIFMAGLVTFCSGSAGMSPLAYCSYLTIFFFIFSFILMWFDFEYNMTTII